MMESLSPLTRRIVAVGLLIILVLGALNLIVLPLTDRHAARAAEIEDARRQITAYRKVLARGPALKTQIEKLRQDPRHRRGFLPAATPALAGARLENRLKAMVQASGGILRSTRIQPQEGEGPERVRVTLDFTAGAGELLTVIQKIEAATPWLTTDNVQIRMIPGRNKEPGKITARMEVDAFIWKGAP